MIVRLFFGAILSMLVLADSALAADMAIKAAPLPASSTWTWTGFYGGGNVGYSSGQWNSTNTGGVANFFTAAGFVTTDNPNVNGWNGGFQAGYNWQVWQYWVISIESDFQWSGEHANNSGNVSIVTGSFAFPCNLFAGGCNNTISSNAANNWNLSWFSTVRGRVGVVAGNNWLLYGTGGLAIGETEFANSRLISGTLTAVSTGAVVSSVTPVNTSVSENDTRTGFAVGAGVETKLTANWSAKAEYLYLDFGSHTFLMGTGSDTNVRLRDNIGRVGFNYKFF